MQKQRGFTLVELLVVIVVLGIIATIAVPRFLASQDRAHVVAAVADVDHFRKALAVYEVDYGAYPDQGFGSVAAIAAALIDPSGNDYMILPDGQNFSSFTYTPVNNGESYEISVVATDHESTPVSADPEGTAVQ
ncbi:MAG: prepilin-type N-terminal cleavage/methylation domain-containing protein [bacterium]|nr:prepilin-type N-terminal cleavage/methylation domain-containing protein [bacterium]MBK8127560.1 prepilin-type N-terminal cleavage/methylation domain-containing protein [bacterium]